jgi:general secretion pathway protein H
MAQQVSVRHKSNVIARNRGDAAFTLIELLVVIVIVGIVSAVALLSFGILGDDRNLQREARRLGSLIELANDEATMQGRDYGMEIMQSGYRFLEHDPLTEQWQEIFGDETLRPRQLEEQMEFGLFIEDRRVLLEEEAAETEEDEDEDDTNRNSIDDYIPHVLILSSGDITPFELRIVRSQDRTEVTMTMSLLGEFEIQTNDQQAF